MWQSALLPRVAFYILRWYRIWLIFWFIFFKTHHIFLRFISFSKCTVEIILLHHFDKITEKMRIIPEKYEIACQQHWRKHYAMEVITFCLWRSLCGISYTILNLDFTKFWYGISVNPFPPNVPFLDLQKTSENFRFFDVFRGYKKGTLGRSGLRECPV